MKKTLIGCLVAGTVAMVILVACVLLWVVRDLPALDATLSLPSEATVNSTVTMVVSTKNNHSEDVSLDSIDIEEAFLEGFQVVRIEPAPTDTYLVFSHRTWVFEKPVSPGAGLDVTFTLKVLQEGRFTGEIGVCNPNQDCKTLLADVVVKKE